MAPGATSLLVGIVVRSAMGGAGAAAAGRDLAVFERYLESKPEAMINTLAYLEEKYTSVQSYLERIGLTHAQIAQLRQHLIDA